MLFTLATYVPDGVSGCRPPHVPIRTRVNVRCASFSVRVLKSIFANASSSLTTMSILSQPIPVLSTVMRLP